MATETELLKIMVEILEEQLLKEKEKSCLWESAYRKLSNTLDDLANN